jgi:hypothetical protein
MSLRAHILLLTLVAISAPGCAAPRDDMAAPEPGHEFTASMPTSGSVWLHWTAAMDDTTLAAELEYRAYFSLANDLATVLGVLAHGTPVGDWLADSTQLRVDGLALDTPYYFNVLVRDEAGNMAVYRGATATTSGGAWREEEPLEDFSEGSDLRPVLALHPEGDVLAYWFQFLRGVPHFATRARDADTFGAAAPWSAENVRTPAIAHGFDGMLMGASFRDNSEGKSDVLFGSRAEGGDTVFETVATDLVTEFSWYARACVSENGDAMVAWVDSTSLTSSVVNARFRTESTWGTTSLVSGGDPVSVSDFHVVCSPDGNHLVVYGVQEDTTNVWHARVYDADREDWEGPATPLSDENHHTFTSARAADGRVVVGWGADNAPGGSFRVRVHERNEWSPMVHTVADDVYNGAYFLALTAAGNDVHAAWLENSERRTRRLDAASSIWSPVVPFDGFVSSQFCIAGDPLGGVLHAWTTLETVHAQIYSRGSQSWGPVEMLYAGGDIIGNASLTCVVDPWRRATVAWTLRDPANNRYSVFARTYR